MIVLLLPLSSSLDLAQQAVSIEPKEMIEPQEIRRSPA